MGAGSTGYAEHGSRGSEGGSPSGRGFVRPGGGRRGYHTRSEQKEDRRIVTAPPDKDEGAKKYHYDLSRVVTENSRAGSSDLVVTETPEPFVYPGGGRRSKAKSLRLPKLRIKAMLGGMVKSKSKLDLKSNFREEGIAAENYYQEEEQASNFVSPGEWRVRDPSFATASSSRIWSTSPSQDGASDRISPSTSSSLFGRPSAIAFPSSRKSTTTQDGSASDQTSRSTLTSTPSSLFVRASSVASTASQYSQYSSMLDLDVVRTQSHLGDHDRREIHDVKSVPNLRPKSAGDAERNKRAGKETREKGIVRRREQCQGWSGEWNQRDMQVVINKLRGLK